MGINMDQDRLKASSKAGSAHPLARYVQDVMQAEAMGETFNRIGLNHSNMIDMDLSLPRDDKVHVIIDVGSKY
jgi:hypothetical protein